MNSLAAVDAVIPVHGVRPEALAATLSACLKGIKAEFAPGSIAMTQNPKIDTGEIRGKHRRNLLRGEQAHGEVPRAWPLLS